MTASHRWATGPPLVPDPDQARDWVAHELAKPEYATAQPTPFDRIAKALWDFVTGLLGGDAPAGWNGTLLVVGAIVVLLLFAAAFLIWGRPRVSARSRASTAELFGDREGRTATRLRADAESRAAAGDWDAAIVLRFRGLARGLVERGVLETAPGATVHAFAREAALAFPEESAVLDAAATAFDDVRYLRRPGNPVLYALVRDADAAVTAARPVLSPALSGTPA